MENELFVFSVEASQFSKFYAGHSSSKIRKITRKFSCKFYKRTFLRVNNQIIYIFFEIQAE